MKYIKKYTEIFGYSMRKHILMSALHNLSEDKGV